MQVLRPQLPTAERLQPYLQRIDATRTYSNWGPLACELETRLREHLRVPPGGVTSASSGTVALVGAILASAGRATEERPFALVPAFTFVGTAAAVEQCGYRPYLADIDPDTWMLDPERLSQQPTLDRIGVAVPVAPFGRPVPQSQWLAFRDTTGIPVVIDGAASFDRMTKAPYPSSGDIPVALSFHATKCFATGEGGCVVTTDAGLASRARQALNFGFYGTRETRSPSVNGKMSEYHAAVGLAELDGWLDKLLALETVVGHYRQRLAETGLEDHLVATPDIGASYVLFRCNDDEEAERLQDALTSSGVDWRLWYGRGLHQHSYFRGAPRERLECTEGLAPCLVGLPLAPDLTEATVAQIVDGLAHGLADSE